MGLLRNAGWREARPGWRGETDDDDGGIKRITLGEQPHAGLILGAGTSTYKCETTDADTKFASFYTRSNVATGTSRGLYWRHYLDGGNGGEALRAFCTVGSNAPVDTVNGAHISLDFGASAGNITGLGTAVRATLHVPTRSLGGTIAALQAELYGDGASGAIGGVASFLRMLTDGHADMKNSFDDNGFLFDIQGLTAGAAHVFRTGLTPATLNGYCSAALRIRVGATTYYLPAATATA
jgi:hypothetical protein